jgi:CRISPR-associated exonuclease Cas4
MKITGTIINYYFHCKRQCYLFANRINMEDNSEDVRIGRVLHEIKAKDEKNTEIKFENMVLDKMTEKNIEEFKKSDADIRAARMQLLFYLKNLEDKGVQKEGKLVCREKNKQEKIEKVVLNDETRKELESCIDEINELVNQDEVPKLEKRNTCNRCAYYEYCYI